MKTQIEFRPGTVAASRQSVAGFGVARNESGALPRRRYGCRSFRAPSATRSLLPGLIGAFLATFVGVSAGSANQSLSLAGQWRFALDRGDVGIQERWFERALPGQVKLPGSLPEQGIGDDISTNTVWTGGIVDKSWFTAPQYEKYRQPGNVKIPFWLQPEKYYAGVAWYQRDIEIPAEWRAKRVVLFLERAHWETRVWVDSRPVGTNNSLATPHEYDLGQLAAGKHTVSIRVDNRMVIDVGENSHCVSDHTQGNWNGIVGKIELRAGPPIWIYGEIDKSADSPVWIEDVQIHPEQFVSEEFLGMSCRGTRVRIVIGNKSGRPMKGELWLKPGMRFPPADFVGLRTNIVVPPAGLTAEFIARGPLLVWDEFSPNRCDIETELYGEITGGDLPDYARGPRLAYRHDFFGLRKLVTEGTQFAINGREAFLRGTLDCCIFPKTGHPPTEVEEWRRIIRVTKSYGLNLIRFHSWCPPEAAFQAADELGFYFHVETCWPNQSTTLGDGKPVDQWVYDETDRILKAYGNHPSFLLMAAGNEPGGKNANAWLAKYVAHYKALDPRRLWTSGAGWPQLPENQFHVTPDPRIQSWGGGVKSRINAKPPETITDYRDYITARNVPVISHEIGQWCVYPNFDEIKKYTGYLKPKNFEIFRETLTANHLGDLARQFLLASGKLQVLCYKEEIESALRTPGMGGFELLDLHDFPGQGTALVGVLDPFWEEKGYVTAQEFSQFCNSTVPLARLKKRVFTTDEKLEAEIEVAHFGAAPLENASTSWALVNDEGTTFARGTLPEKTISVDNGVPLGQLSFDLKSNPAPAHGKLVVTVERGLQSASTSARRSGMNAAVMSKFENDWDVWVYPAKLDSDAPADVLIADHLNDAALTKLNAGGKVLLTIPPNRVKPDPKLGKVALGFSSIFWNTAWTQRQPPHTLGILCDPKHPLFADFPTDYHSNWQWWYLISRASAMILDDLPPALRPTVQVIDDWVTNRRLGLVFEARVLKGRVVVTSIDLSRELETNPVARQMRHSILRYMTGARFQPKVELSPDQIRSLMLGQVGLHRFGVFHATADSEDIRSAAEACDGDPRTIWHTWGGEARPGFPHWLQVEFSKPVSFAGFSALPRQDGKPTGHIGEYEFYAGDDGQRWGQPVARGAFANDRQLKTVRFGQPVKARCIKLVARSSHDGGPWASLAELDLLGGD